jgi:hypothetical protein
MVVKYGPKIMAGENVVLLFTLVYIYPFDANKYCAP